jgi:hypothetical protein
MGGAVDFTTLLYKEEKKPSAVWIIEFGILLSTYFSLTEFSEKFFKFDNHYLGISASTHPLNQGR